MRTLFSLCFLGAFVRFLLVFLSLGPHNLCDRFNFISPSTSFKRIAEASFLLDHHKNPYQGNIYHQQTIILKIIKAINYDIGTHQQEEEGEYVDGNTSHWLGLPPYFSIHILYVAIDIAIALMLYQITKIYHERNSIIMEQEEKTKITVSTSNRSSLSSSSSSSSSFHFPHFVAAFWLFNPLTILTNLSLSTLPLLHFFIVLSIYSAISKQNHLTAFALAVAIYIDLYPIAMMIPITLLLVKKRRNEKEDNLFAGSQLFALLFPFLLTLFYFALLLLLSSTLFSPPSFAFVLDSYLFNFSISDLTPNLGLFWYFFTEIFDRFRSFFLIVFHTHFLFYLIPLTIRFHTEPLFLTWVTIGIPALFRGQPTLGDMAFSLAVGLCSGRLIRLRLRRSVYLIVFLLCMSIVLMELMWFLWIESGSGNANFLYFQSLIYIFSQGFCIIETIGSVRRWKANQEEIEMQKQE